MGGVTEFRTKLQMYAAEMGFEYVLVKNNPVHVTAICSRRVSELCCWRVHASFCKEDGSFSIRTLNNKHSCTGIIRKNSRTVLSSKVIVMLIEHLLRKDPSYSPIKVVKYIDDSFCLRVPYRVAHYALEKCREKVHGDEDESFNRLARYVKLIMTSNPGSHCTLDIDSRTRRFERVFISFDASIKGFRMCRPLVFFDGTHLRNKYQGTLLVAVAKDANQGIYPLAFAVVSNESNENWLWFAENVRYILREETRQISLMSDRNKGLIAAVRQTFPNNPYSFCMNHMVENLKLKFPGGKNKKKRGAAVKLFQKCVYAPTKTRFQRYYNKLIGINRRKVFSFLKGAKLSNWANAYYEGERYGDTCTNIVESFNKWILVERYIPITELVDAIRLKIMRMFGERAVKLSNWNNVLTPRMERKLAEAVHEGKELEVVKASESEYEVTEKKKSFVVNVFNGTCTCEFWRIDRFPCHHAATVYKRTGIDIYRHIDQYFWSATYNLCYSSTIHPVVEDPYQVATEEVMETVHPPVTKRPPGRPATKRKRSRSEMSRQIKCTRCGKINGHNRRTCTEPI